MHLLTPGDEMCWLCWQFLSLGAEITGLYARCAVSEQRLAETFEQKRRETSHSKCVVCWNAVMPGMLLTLYLKDLKSRKSVFVLLANEESPACTWTHHPSLTMSWAILGPDFKEYTMRRNCQHSPQTRSSPWQSDKQGGFQSIRVVSRQAEQLREQQKVQYFDFREHLFASYKDLESAALAALFAIFQSFVKHSAPPIHPEHLLSSSNTHWLFANTGGFVCKECKEN